MLSTYILIPCSDMGENLIRLRLVVFCETSGEFLIQGFSVIFCLNRLAFNIYNHDLRENQFFYGNWNFIPLVGNMAEQGNVQTAAAALCRRYLKRFIFMDFEKNFLVTFGWMKYFAPPLSIKTEIRLISGKNM